MKKLLLGIAVIAILTSCDRKKESADEKMKKQTDAAMLEMNRAVGMPAITNWQERKLAKQIFELRDKADLICYAYIKSDYTGKFTFIGKCIGYGLPYSIQYTNPSKLTVGLGDTSRTMDFVMPQADPNGLFMPSGLSATWLMLIDPKDNKAKPAYIEETITVTQFPLPESILNGEFK